MAYTICLTEMWTRPLCPTPCKVRPIWQAVEATHRQWRAGSLPVEVDIGLGLVSYKHNWLITAGQLWAVEIANATQVRGFYHMSLFLNTFAGAKMLLTHLQCKGKTFFPGNWFTFCSCSQSPALCNFLLCHLPSMYSSLSPKFCSIIAARSPVWSYPTLSCLFYLPDCQSQEILTWRRIVKRPSSLRVASDLFPFFSSCHSSLLLNLSCLLNLICVFLLLLDWRYVQSCCSAYSKGDSSILLPSFKSSSSVYNVFFPFKSLLPLQFEVGSSFLSPALDPGAWRELTLLSPFSQPPKSSVPWSGKSMFSFLVTPSECL